VGLSVLPAKKKNFFFSLLYLRYGTTFSLTVEAIGVLLGQVLGGELAFLESLVAVDIAQEGNVVCDAFDDIRVERIEHDRQSLRTVLAVRDELADHGIVVHRDLRTLDDTRVNPDASVIGLGLDVRSEATFRGETISLLLPTCYAKLHTDGREVLGRVFGIDTALKRPALDANV